MDSKIFYFTSALLLVGCGGGGESSTSMPPSNTPQPIAGGPLSVPTLMSINSAHKISGDYSQNYFKIEGSEGQTIVIYSDLDTYLDDQSVARCSSSPTSYYIGISLVDTDIQSCSTNFETTFDSSGTKVFRFGFPYNNPGTFSYAVIGDSDDLSALTANGKGGLPDKPRLVDLNSNNVIEVNNLYNYYVYQGVAGETIVIKAYLNANYTGHDPARCSSSLGADNFENHYAYGIAIDSRRYNCSDELIYTFQNDATRIIHFKYIKEVSGYFRLTTDR